MVDANKMKIGIRLSTGLVRRTLTQQGYSYPPTSLPSQDKPSLELRFHK